MNTTVIIWTSVICLWAFIIWLQIALCKKIVWLRYDVIQRMWAHRVSETIIFDDKLYDQSSVDHLPTNQDWLDEIYNHGGPLITIPVFDIVVVIISIIQYLNLKIDLSYYNELEHPEKYWENKRLKR